MKFIIICTTTPYNEETIKKIYRMGYQIDIIDISGHFLMIERPMLVKQNTEATIDLKKSRSAHNITFKMAADES